MKKALILSILLSVCAGLIQAQSTSCPTCLTSDVVGTNRGRASYTSLNAAVTAIGATTTTLTISSPINQTTTNTVPANIGLSFTGNGAITVSTGMTLTIRGPVSVVGGPRQIFTLSGTGVVSFSGNRGLTANLAWFGVDCTGAADGTAKLQAAINATPDYSTLTIPPNCIVQTTDTVTINSRIGMTFSGGGTNSVVKYLGANDLPVLSVDGSKYLTFDNFYIDCFGKANKAIEFKKSAGTTYINSFCLFHRMFFQGTTGGAVRPNWWGLDICNTGLQSNCEGFHVDESTFSCGGQTTGSIGVAIGHSNSLTHTIEKSEFAFCGNNIYNNKGSFTARANLFDHADIDIISYNDDPIIIDFNRSENAKGFFKSTGIHGPVIMRGNVFGITAASPYTWIDTRSAGGSATLFFEGNVFAATPNLVVFNGSSGALVSTGNNYDPGHIIAGTKKIATWEAFDSGYISLADCITEAGQLRSSFSAGGNRTIPGWNPWALVLDNEDSIGAYTTTNARGNLAAMDVHDNVQIGDLTFPTLIQTSLAAPNSNSASDGHWWVECVGTTPSRVCALKTKDGGSVVILATTTH